MKRFLAAAAAAIIGLSAFAQEKNNILCAGISFPQVNYDIDGENFKASGVEAHLHFYSIDEKGLAFTYGLDVGKAAMKDLVSDDKNGAYVGLNFGVGFAPVRNDKFVFGVAGIIGGTMSGHLAEKTNEVSWDTPYYIKQKFFVITFDIGADIFAAARLSKRIGLFADMMLKYKAGSTQYEYEFKTNGVKTASSNDSYSTTGFEFTPSFGVSIHL